jgi:zinc/manganese transport system substrate-binding protein
MEGDAVRTHPTRSNRRTAGLLASFVALASTAAAGCGGDGSSEGDSSGPATIVVTNSIWADVASNVACDGLAEVTSLLPPGADPHAYEPSMADRGRMEDATLVVANGLGLEAGLDDTLESVEAGGVTVFRATDHVATLPLSGGADHDEVGSADGDASRDDTHEHAHAGDDPHVWQDPMRTAEVVAALGDVLVAEVGLDAAAVQRCVEGYTAELEALDAQVGEMTSRVPAERRVLVTNHDALGYFADRYDFEVLGTVIPGPGALTETNPAEIEALAQAIDEAGVPAVFAEEQHSDADARALAARVGDVQVVTLHTDALGAAGSGAASYLEMVRSNGQLVSEALGDGDP